MTPEELRSIAGQCDSRAAFESSGMTVSALIEAAAALRECAASLERAEPVAFDTENPRCRDGGEACTDCLCSGKCLAPPRSEPPKMTDEEIDAITDKQWWTEVNKPIYAAHRAYARAICDLRDKQWRGE